MKNLITIRRFYLSFLSIVFSLSGSFGQDRTNFKLFSPDSTRSIDVALKNGVPEYSVYFHDKQLITPSKLGFEFQDYKPKKYEIIEFQPSDSRKSMVPIYGENSKIDDHYNAIVLKLRSKINLNIEFRAYNSGIAFRYVFPENQSRSSLTIIKELSEFSFIDGATAYPIYQGEATFSKVPVPIKDIQQGALYPLTINTGLGFASLLEANVVNYTRLKFGKTESGGLVTSIMDKASIAFPFSTPWRLIMIGDTEKQLIENEWLVQSLNPENRIKDVSWIKPGLTISNESSVPLNTVELKKLVDFAAASNFKYVQLDWGWYGTEVKWSAGQIESFRKVMPKYMEGTNWEKNAEANPFSTGKGYVPYGWDERWKDFQTYVDLDLKELISYGKSKGIGICLYVEAGKTLRENNLDSLFATYQRWGVAGIKPGFVRYGTQENTEWIRNMVATASRYNLWVCIHDAHVPDGMERTYPNLFTVEGGGGAEGNHPVVQDVMLPFTRCLAGPFDYTPFLFTKGRSNTHMIGMLLTYWSPSHIIRGGYLAWHGDGSIGTGGEEIEFIKRLPSSWDETRILDAKIGEYLVTARRKGETWFIGGITGDNMLNLKLDLGFLKSDKEYKLTVFEDDKEKASEQWCPVKKRVLQITKNSKLELSMVQSGGYAAIIEPISKLEVDEKLIYHQIQLNPADSTIIAWYSNNLGQSYDFGINAVWNFWNNMRLEKNGLPYYMCHQVWRADFNDPRGIGGDQFAMALSSWNLYYAYSGNETVKEEMKFIADYYLHHSLSPANAKYPNIPFPYNTMTYSGVYDGDMLLGKDYTHLDKAGSFGFELVKLFKMTNQFPWPKVADKKYLDAAINIANTLAKKVKEGDNDNSPLPFKVNVFTGETGKLNYSPGSGPDDVYATYTTNWSGTMELFLNLIALKADNSKQYQKVFNTILYWMKKYPLKNNKWGPVFEDSGWSESQITATTFAQFIMNHREYFPNWKADVKSISDWVYGELGNKKWQKYGVVVVNEQTGYRLPGNSHTSRQASAELQYAKLSGDQSQVPNAIRSLNWATYMVDNDGKNCYPGDEVWLTDGYGDYVRHYLRAMAWMPELAPDNQNHLLSTTSVIQLMEYPPLINKSLTPYVPAELVKSTLLNYRTYDDKSVETIRLTEKPVKVLVNLLEILESENPESEGWSWNPMEKGGLLTVRHLKGNKIVVLK